MEGKIRLGPFFWVFGVFLTLILTMALTFLGIVPWEEIQILFIVGWGGGLVVILVAGKVGMTREGPFSSMVFVAVAVGLVALMIESAVIGAFFGLYSVDPSRGVLVNFLSAMYEETFFLGVDSAGAAGNLPVPARLLLLSVAFVPYHAFRYPVEMLFYVVILFVGRMTFDSLRIISRHSDPPFIVHGAWNVLATIFGGI